MLDPQMAKLYHAGKTIIGALKQLRLMAQQQLKTTWKGGSCGWRRLGQVEEKDNKRGAHESSAE